MKVCEVIRGQLDWTQGASARDGRYHHCSPTSDKAVYFCISGAIQKCYGYAIVDFLTVLYKVTDHLGIPGEQLALQNWNDEKGRTIDEILKLIEDLDI